MFFTITLIITTYVDIMFIDLDGGFMQMPWMKLSENFYQLLCL